VHVTIFFKVTGALFPKTWFMFLGENTIQNKQFDPSHVFLKAILMHIELVSQKSSKKAEI
jgi:hypothetical protein